MADKILTITKADLDPENFYIGAANAANFAGKIEIAPNLGLVRFRGALKASLSISAGAGSGIEAGSGIKAGFTVTAKWVIVRMRIFVGCCPWRIPMAEEMQLRAEILGGTLAFGTHVPPANTTRSPRHAQQ